MVANTIDRRIWKLEQSAHWWEHIVKETFSDHDWMENFRMNRTTFDYLCTKLAPVIERQRIRLCEPIPVDQCVAIAVWCLATSVEYHTVSHLFGVSRASVCLILKDVCRAIQQQLLCTYIKFPQGEDLKSVIEGFKRKWDFPNCAGAIDGTHVPIIAPQDNHVDFFNRKGWYSIVMQAVVDDCYCFRDICIGWPGSVHDARVLRNSEVFKQAVQGTLFPSNQTVDIEGTHLPVLILGDPAYPLLPWLMKPFPKHCLLTREQRHFNYCLSRARMTVENTFGRLKGRWRRILKRLDVTTNDVPLIVIACCVLHNICEIHHNEFNSEWLDSIESTQIPQPHSTVSDNEPSENASEIRQALVHYFSSV